MSLSPCAQPTTDPLDIPAEGDCSGPDSRVRPLARTVYGPESAQDGFQVLAPEWNPLLAKSRFNSLFLTHEWQTTWWAELGDGELWILAFRDPADGALVGIVPLYRVLIEEGEDAGQFHFHWVGCTEVSDYLDAIIAQEWEDAVYASLLEWLASPEAPEWHLLDLCNLPEDSLTYRCLPRQAEGRGLQVQVFQEDVAPYIPLPLHYDEYLMNQVDKKQRHEIRRKQRRALRDNQVRFYFVGPEDDLEQEVADFIRLQRMSSRDKKEFMTPTMQRFFQAIARRMMEMGTLRLAFLTLNGEKAATYFSFEYDRRFLVYNSGYHTGELARYSPGWVLLAYLIQYTIAVGCRVFDFLQGDEEYKYHFGSQDYKVMRVLVRNPAPQPSPRPAADSADSVEPTGATGSTPS